MVRAIDAAGNVSDPSNDAPVTVPDTVKPTAPGNLRTTAVTSQPGRPRLERVDRQRRA